MCMSVGIMFVDVNLAVTIACCLSGQPNQRVCRHLQPDIALTIPQDSTFLSHNLMIHSYTYIKKF
jgi:hypothetical protein